MNITKSQLVKIISEEIQKMDMVPAIGSELPNVQGGLELPSAQNMISSFAVAINALRKGNSFTYTEGGAAASELSSLAGPEGIVSNLDGKTIIGIGGAVVLLILVAMSLGYSVKVGGGYGETSGEIIFTAPSEEIKG